MSRRKSGSYIGGHTIVGPHTGWFSGVGKSKKRVAKKKGESKNKRRKARLAQIIEEAEAAEKSRRQRRELTQAKLRSHQQPENQPIPESRKAKARMSQVTVVRKNRARPVLRLKSDKIDAGK